MVLGQGLLIVVIGWFAGGAATLGLTRYVRSLLFGVPPGDVPTFALASFVIVAAAIVGCLVPALTASRIDPAMALRME